ncbi:MAG: epoxide hydrolase N-terminal domain-containing protein, partial [Methylobacteriaceae bacterium]|nr:epoxide hydrolase N-terminal domain-containing protein [Methylobacteriaceae bacterium]
MSAPSLSPTRRELLAAGAAAAATSMLPASLSAAADDSIRLFRVNFPEEALVDLRRRLTATRWPERETVSDDSQGMPLAMMEDLARYWASDYDWRRCEAKLNALPQ